MASTFGHHSTAEEVVSTFGCKGKRFLVTGGLSGIGLETVVALAKGGAQVVVVHRDGSSREALEERLGDAKAAVQYAKADLGSLASVRAGADEVIALGGDPYNAMILNAGVMAPSSRRETVDGFEFQMGTNHLGHFLLVAKLIHLLDRNGGRVVVVSSIAHRRADVNFDDLQWKEQPFDKWSSYGASKMANILFAKELNSRFAASGRNQIAVSLHPGGILTNLQRELPHEEMVAMGWISADGTLHEAFKTPAQGASTSVYCALAPIVSSQGGSYYDDCAVAEPLRPQANDASAAAKLWTESEKLVGVQFKIEN